MTAVDIDDVFADEEVATIDNTALQYVTGGRIDAGPQTVDPKVMQAFQQGSQAFQQGCQSFVQKKQQDDSQSMQMVQQMMGGGGKGGGGRGAQGQG
ncbi:MAG TPA: hypothetical protein VH143_05070 [Kofleriaceae bacterium]|nr:hypothetical protein [Kofleriaceae bacterium]